MTREEFMPGWLLLTIQPWGRKYAGQDATAKLQFEFYWSRLERFHAAAWNDTCRLFAAGERWPSVDELRHAIHSSLPAGVQLTYSPELTEKPELFAKIEIYQEQHGCTTLEAAESVLPEFSREHQEAEVDEQIAECEKLIKRLKAHRAHMQVLKQEREANHA